MTDQSSWEQDRGWTPARIDMLYLHYALGMTAGQSAQVLGGVSGNAVQSKRMRLGLASKAPAGAVSALFTGRRVRFSAVMSLCREPLPEMDFPTPPGARPSRLADRGSANAPGRSVPPSSQATIAPCIAVRPPAAEAPIARSTPSTFGGRHERRRCAAKG